VIEFVTIAGLLAAMSISFVFSGMEAGLFALSRVRIRHMMRLGDRLAARLYNYLEHPERFLWTILIGNTIANFLLVTLVVIRFYELWSLSRIFWLGLCAVLFTSYVLLDLLPKVLFQRLPNRMCLALVNPFRWLAACLAPIIAPVAWFAEWLTPGEARIGQFFGNREEFRALVQEGKNPLTSDERMLIDRVLSLQKLTVQRIAIPWEKVTKVNESTPASFARELAAERGFSRIPVESDEERKVVGILSLKSVIFSPKRHEESKAEDFMTPALIFDPATRLEEVLNQFQQGGHRMGVVVDEGKHPIGIVTLTDVLKVMFGEVTL
jgi:putative hemolysin